MAVHEKKIHTFRVSGTPREAPVVESSVVPVNRCAAAYQSATPATDDGFIIIPSARVIVPRIEALFADVERIRKAIVDLGDWQQRTHQDAGVAIRVGHA